MKERARGMIAMSGGVDSSVAALLLRREGYDCLGVNLRLYRNTDLGLACHKSCCSQEDADDAASVAFQLGMDFETLDYTNLFRLRVMGPFVQAYLKGLTPNPCLECNRHMKFDLLLHTALDRGFDVLATGHYARVGRDPASGRWAWSRPGRGRARISASSPTGTTALFWNAGSAAICPRARSWISKAAFWDDTAARPAIPSAREGDWICPWGRRST